MQTAQLLAKAMQCLGEIPDGQRGDGASAHSSVCVVGASSVQSRLFLGSTDLPGSRTDPTYLEGDRATTLTIQPLAIGLPVFTPSWLVSVRLNLLRKSARRKRGLWLLRNPQGQLVGAGFIGC